MGYGGERLWLAGGSRSGQKKKGKTGKWSCALSAAATGAASFRRRLGLLLLDCGLAQLRRQTFQQ